MLKANSNRTDRRRLFAFGFAIYINYVRWSKRYRTNRTWTMRKLKWKWKKKEQKIETSSTYTRIKLYLPTIYTHYNVQTVGNLYYLFAFETRKLFACQTSNEPTSLECDVHHFNYCQHRIKRISRFIEQNYSNKLYLECVKLYDSKLLQLISPDYWYHSKMVEIPAYDNEIENKNLMMGDIVWFCWFFNIYKCDRWNGAHRKYLLIIVRFHVVHFNEFIFCPKYKYKQIHQQTDAKCSTYKHVDHRISITMTKRSRHHCDDDFIFYVTHTCFFNRHKFALEMLCQKNSIDKNRIDQRERLSVQMLIVVRKNGLWVHRFLVMQILSRIATACSAFYLCVFFPIQTQTTKYFRWKKNEGFEFLKISHS